MGEVSYKESRVNPPQVVIGYRTSDNDLAGTAAVRNEKVFIWPIS
jgi:hypothetical protein